MINRNVNGNIVRDSEEVFTVQVLTNPPCLSDPSCFTVMGHQ